MTQEELQLHEEVGLEIGDRSIPTKKKSYIYNRKKH
jgi:hypothetical protein